MSRIYIFLVPLILLASAFDSLDMPVSPPNPRPKPPIIGQPPTEVRPEKPPLPEDPPPQPEEDDGPRLYDEEIPTQIDTIIYVIDISGSMGGGRNSYTGLDGEPAYGSRIERAKVELVKSINSLSEDFKFNVVAYSCNLQRVFESMQQATPENKARAIGWVYALHVGGGTGTGPAGALGLSEKSNQTLVILSDGHPNCGARGIDGHRQMILDADTQHAVIHTFGISANGQFEAFLRSLSDATGGVYHDID